MPLHCFPLEMSAGSIFALPLPPAGRRRITLRPKSPRKRRRNGQHVDLEVDEDASNATRARSDEAPSSVEYTAVVTPAERSQRRLAGVPLDQAPLPPPFPHARPRVNGSNEPQRKSSIAETLNETGESVQRNHTLHFQHLAAMTALLHRCMMARDYARAARAVGLLLRNEVNGHAIDIRNAGLWGISAEILLHQGDSQDLDLDAHGWQADSITRGGLERAKLFYKRLIVQYPPNKTWPDVINALDFSISMFGLWIYVVSQECLQIQRRAASESSIDTNDITEWKIRQWELEQARQIAEAMDSRMRDIAFNSFPELIHQRAMVALWIAGLIETQVRLKEHDDDDNSNMEVQSDQDNNDEDLRRQMESITFDRHNSPQPQPEKDEIKDNRTLARKLMRKVRGLAGEDEETEDVED